MLPPSKQACSGGHHRAPQRDRTTEKPRSKPHLISRAEQAPPSSPASREGRLQLAQTQTQLPSHTRPIYWLCCTTHHSSKHVQALAADQIIMSQVIVPPLPTRHPPVVGSQPHLLLARSVAGYPFQRDPEFPIQFLSCPVQEAMLTQQIKDPNCPFCAKP